MSLHRPRCHKLVELEVGSVFHLISIREFESVESDETQRCLKHVRKQDI